MKLTLLTITLLLVLSSVRGQSPGDSTVNLSKKVAVYYYEQAKLAKFYKKASLNAQAQRDSAFEVVGEKNIQLKTYKVELDASKTLNEACRIEYAVVKEDNRILVNDLKIMRRQRNGWFIMSIGLSGLGTYLVIRSLSSG